MGSLLLEEGGAIIMAYNLLRFLLGAKSYGLVLDLFSTQVSYNLLAWTAQ